MYKYHYNQYMILMEFLKFQNKREIKIKFYFQN